MIVLSVLLILVLAGILSSLTLGMYFTSRLFSVIFFSLGSVAFVKYLSSGEKNTGRQRRQPRYQYPRDQHSSRERQEPKAPASREDTVLTEKTVDRVDRSEKVEHLFREGHAAPLVAKAPEAEGHMAPARGRKQTLGRYELISPGMARLSGYATILTANEKGFFLAMTCDEKVCVTLPQSPIEGVGSNLARYGIQDLFYLYDDKTNQLLDTLPTGRVMVSISNEANCRRHGDGQIALVEKGIAYVTRR